MSRAEEEEYVSGDYRYSTNADGTATIARYTGSGTELVLPEKLDGRQVTAIGDHAFDSRWGLRSLTLPEGITRIGDLAFYECESLVSLALPDSVASLGVNPFCLCPARLSVPPGHPALAVMDGVLFDKTQNKLISFPYGDKRGSYRVPEGTLGIGGMAFFECDSLVTVILPDGLTDIGDEAFSSCYRLMSLRLPGSLRHIGKWAFSECFPLFSLELPEGLEYIGDMAFYDCASLESLILPLSLKSFGDNPFARCPARISVKPGHPTLEAPDGVLIDSKQRTLIAFPFASDRAAYVVPDNIRSIGVCAFYECQSLAEITLPEGLEEIGGWAFYETGLRSLAFPGSLRSIGDNAFSLCYDLDSVTLPEGLETVGEYAFNGCFNLVSLTLPKSLSFIGEAAFHTSDELIVQAFRGSFAAEWAYAEGLTIRYLKGRDPDYRIRFDDFSWPPSPAEPVEGPTPGGPEAALFGEGVASITSSGWGNLVDFAYVGESTVHRAFFEGEYCIASWTPEGTEMVMVGNDNPNGFLTLEDAIVCLDSDAGWVISRWDASAYYHPDPDEGPPEDTGYGWRDTPLSLDPAYTAFFADSEHIYYFTDSYTVGRISRDGQASEVLGTVSGPVLAMLPGRKVLLANFDLNQLRLWDGQKETVLYGPQETILSAFSFGRTVWVQHEGWFGPVENGMVAFRLNGRYEVMAGSQDQLVLLVLPDEDAVTFDVMIFNEPYRAYALMGRIAYSDIAHIEMRTDRVIVWGDWDSLTFELPAPERWMPFGGLGSRE